MDNDASTQQQTTAPQADPAPAAAEPQKSFGQLTDEEQQDVLRESFFKDVDEPDENEEADNAASSRNDGTEDEKQQPAEKAEATEGAAEGTPAGEAPGLYTPEEFLLLSPEEVDSARLPDAARIVHERDMRYFNETIRPQLEELKALKARQNQPPAQQPQQTEGQQTPPADAMQEFNNAVKKEAARRLGVESIDEFNADHNIMVSLVAGEFQRAAFEQQAQARNQQMQMQAAQQNYAQVMSELQQEYGSDFAVIDRWALAEMNNLPVGVANKVMNDLRSGDPVRIKGVYKQFVDRYKAAKGTPAPKQQKEVAEPPRLINGSGGGDQGSSGWGMKEWKSADADTKVRMLQETFFNDK